MRPTGCCVARLRSLARHRSGSAIGGLREFRQGALIRFAMRFEDINDRTYFFPTRHSLNACLTTCTGGINENLKRQKLRRASFLKKLALYLQIFYEKSRLRYIFPILVLVAYSFLGGFIFYTIESPEEQRVLLRKKEYIEREEAVILREIVNIESRVRAIHRFYNTTELQQREIRYYRSFAMNRLNKAIYWYVLQVYYLNDQESYKTSLLHPVNPERIWRTHFTTNFGRIHALRNYTQQLSDRCWEIGLEMNQFTVAKTKLDEAIKLFNRWTGLHHVLTPTWTFWNSMFLAVTTYTTIGYGNVTAKSKLGKLACMIYAVIGIPLVLMILHRLGHYFLVMLQKVWDYFIRVMEMIRCVKNADRLRAHNVIADDEERASSMPVTLAIGIAGGWMFLCSAIFLKFEKDWDYFKSFYFFFCSLTTIGYGDVTPTHSEDMFIIFGFIIIGLSLVSMCINVVQLKLENLFEELLMAVLEEYGEAEGDGIIDAENIRGNFGLIDLWKMFKHNRRKKAARRRATMQADVEVPPPPAMNDVRSSMSSQNIMTPKSTRLADLKELKKTFPFMAKRRREVLLQQFHTKLHQLSKATQTDGTVGNTGVYYHEARPLSVAHEIDEMSWEPSSETVPDSSSSLPVMESSVSSDRSLQRMRVTINDNASSSSSSYARRYLPSRSERRPTPTSGSIKSAPNATPLPNSDESGPPPEYSGVRRWTFFEIGKTPRGAPRGLVIPYMYTHRAAGTHETTEVKRLISELDARLLQCRTLISPCSRSASRATNRSELNSSQASSLRNISPLTKDSH
uniref:TWiK family of potassium channels protein 7 n=1 Tax=Panagrellus redivivus TaxID=6233 RepID=A0A7E4ZRN7_PANRE